MTQQRKQQLLDEMRQDILEEARADEAYERKMRSSIDFALDELENEYHFTECFISINDAIKKLNSLGYDITLQELIDLY